jgi:ABC-type protease/lipase transport system fused ATPase/permease subunit
VLLAIARASEPIDDAIDRWLERRHERVERRRIARAMARHERKQLRLGVCRRGGGWALTAIHQLHSFRK